MMRRPPASSGVPRSFTRVTAESAGIDKSIGHALKATSSVNKPWVTETQTSRHVTTGPS